MSDLALLLKAQYEEETMAKTEDDFHRWWGEYLDDHPQTRPAYAYPAAKAAFCAAYTTALAGIRDPEAWVQLVRRLIEQHWHEATMREIRNTLRALERAERGEASDD